MAFEPHAGGRIYERTPEGAEHEAGTAVRIGHRGWERLGAVAEERRGIATAAAGAA